MHLGKAQTFIIFFKKSRTKSLVIFKAVILWMIIL